MIWIFEKMHCEVWTDGRVRVRRLIVVLVSRFRRWHGWCGLDVDQAIVVQLELRWSDDSNCDAGWRTNLGEIQLPDLSQPSPCFATSMLKIGLS